MLENGHPYFRNSELDWEKFRLTYEGGKHFVNTYLKKFSDSETDAELVTRKAISYCPAFAKAALKDVLNPIYQRMSEIDRLDGDTSYQLAITGKAGGVDLAGTSMDSFIGRVILPELLVTGKVGTYVEMPELTGNTLKDNLHKRPYIYHYTAENIINWETSIKNNNLRFTRLLLREYKEVFSDIGFIIDYEVTYRLLQLTEEGNVSVTEMTADGTSIDTKILNLTEIPFVLFDIGPSLLQDVADYQIALLNLESSDIMYLLKSNIPFYVEQYDAKNRNPHQKGEAEDVQIGVGKGRRFDKTLDFPQYIHPSSEPVEAAMKKEENIKRDMRLLINLAITNIQPKMASEGSKAADNLSLEAGLSNLGLILESAERQIAEYWAAYLNTTPADVKYPAKYTIRSTEEVLKISNDFIQSSEVVPSITYKREALKKAAALKLGREVSDRTMTEINSQIDKSDVFYSSASDLLADVEAGLLTTESASLAKGYPKGETQAAKLEHAERLERIIASQTKPTGVDDLDTDSQISKDQKLGKETRGEGKQE